MNSMDIRNLEFLNERYSEANMTGFKLVTGKTTKGTFLRHFEMDLEILRTSDVSLKDVVRVMFRDDAIDICSHDNGTPVSYFFTHDACFRPKDIMKEVMGICETFAVGVE